MRVVVPFRLLPAIPIKTSVEVALRLTIGEGADLGYPLLEEEDEPEWGDEVGSFESRSVAGRSRSSPLPFGPIAVAGDHELVGVVR